MIAPRKIGQHWAPLFALLLVVVLALAACERQLQDQGNNLIPDIGTAGEAEQPAAGDEVEEDEADAEDGIPAEEATAVVEETPIAEEAVTDVPAEEPEAEVTEEEVPATEESPRPADETPAAEETAESTEEPAEEEPAETATEEAAAPESDAETAEEEETEVAEEEAAAEAEEETVAEAEEAEAQATAEATPAAAEERTHVVQAGENLYRIGLQYGISWVVLANYNNLPNANAIVVGQELKIPPDPTAPAGTPTPTPAPSGETTYVVQAGDNLYRIGRLYNISWVLIAEANGLVNPNQIFVGQVLKIPASDTTPAQITHTVQPRETLFLISLHYGVPWMTIASANNLTAPYVIYPGQTLVIPAGG
ncbi:MAG: LysM peptidoglycan-binding domain-containing protein [Anaerolineae bacterium]|nr:LysM peptidoglycan-binding domain-containing protein [Anaerolineae bacterium]